MGKQKKLTTDIIVKALKYCSKPDCSGCTKCPISARTHNGEHECRDIYQRAAEIIETLREKNKIYLTELKYRAGFDPTCEDCIHYSDNPGCPEDCFICDSSYKCVCSTCENFSNWQYRDPAK